MKYADTICSFVDMKCLEYGGREAMVFPEDGSRYSFEKFRNLYFSLAKGLLKIGVKKGDHVALMSLNSPYAIAFSIAVAKVGAIFVNLNNGYTKREFEYVLQNSMSSTVILLGGTKEHKFIDLFKKICPEIEHSLPGQLKCSALPDLKNIIVNDEFSCGGAISVSELIKLGENIANSRFDAVGSTQSGDEVTAIYYTSGTTGHPKAVMLTHSAMIKNAVVVGNNMGYSENDRVLLCLPIYHAIGYVLTAFLSLIFGSTLIIMERYQTEKVLQNLENERCTVFNAVPTMFNMILKHPDFPKYRFEHLKKGYISGSYCQPSLVKDVMEKLHIKELSIGYGQTEAIVISQTLVSDRMDQRLFTIGRPIKGVLAKVIDPSSNLEVENGMRGELCIKSIYLMKGYFKNQEATDKAVDKDGWLHTGDLVTKDDNGYLTIIGRIKDIIIRGGENIAPIEIESVFKTCSGVKDVAVVGIPDEILGEEICMFVVKDENSNITAKSLTEYAKHRLAKFKIPKFIEFVDILPVTASGKVKLFVLKDMVLHQHDWKNNA